ncbi:hypothetical protein GOP47_0025251 [Adiantum capillus-veneris]|uniref:Uncharacterized protein n=1 Tax=Adiantum capillus-veneris TaxID=13818 RepID=A0A9D4U0Q0_ADICA|nr:hypothetical protein GOP47_0025251 [Adiantum capillus-veneris]
MAALVSQDKRRHRDIPGEEVSISSTHYLCLLCDGATFFKVGGGDLGVCKGEPSLQCDILLLMEWVPFYGL